MMLRGNVLLVDNVKHLRVEQVVEAFERITGARGV